MKIVVIGNGMVGYKFCEKLISKAGFDQFKLAIFGEEIRPAYDRVHLSEFFSGKSANDLGLSSYEWYAENNIRLHLGDPIQCIDRKTKPYILIKASRNLTIILFSQQALLHLLLLFRALTNRAYLSTALSKILK